MSLCDVPDPRVPSLLFIYSRVGSKDCAVPPGLGFLHWEAAWKEGALWSLGRRDPGSGRVRVGRARARMLAASWTGQSRAGGRWNPETPLAPAPLLASSASHSLASHPCQDSVRPRTHLGKEGEGGWRGPPGSAGAVPREAPTRSRSRTEPGGPALGERRFSHCPHAPRLEGSGSRRLPLPGRLGTEEAALVQGGGQSNKKGLGSRERFCPCSMQRACQRGAMGLEGRESA